MDFSKAESESRGGLHDYLSRNAKWLRPAVATVIVIGTPAVMVNLDPNSATFLPGWLVPAGGALGCFAIGMGAATTDTASASAVRLLGFVASAVIVLASIFR